ncbi:hypothetical protein RI054_13g67260 [Pseudoscourfieldia marina]
MAENQSGAARMAQALRRSERLRLSGGAVRFSRAVEPTTPAAVQPRQIPGGSGRVGSLVVAGRVQAPLRTRLSARAAQHGSPFRQPLFSCAEEEAKPIPHGGGSEARQRFCAAGISGSGNAVAATVSGASPGLHGGPGPFGRLLPFSRAREGRRFLSDRHTDGTLPDRRPEHGLDTKCTSSRNPI